MMVSKPKTGTSEYQADWSDDIKKKKKGRSRIQGQKKKMMKEMSY